uniref:RIKEN cDNA A830031A19 gene n=1 Tax=Peromyscus maniculatus bairdii TaxID=230844 RepID=A0A8C8UE08_PERMB
MLVILQVTLNFISIFALMVRQRLRRQLPSSARRGGHGHPGRLHPWRGRPGTSLCLPRRRGPGPHEEGAIVRPEFGTAVPVDVGVIAVATALAEKIPYIMCVMRKGLRKATAPWTHQRHNASFE